MKIKLGAVIPTVQYGNLQPEFEVEADEGQEANVMAYLEAHVQALWDKYGEKPLTTKVGDRKLLKGIGGEIYFEESTHTYTNEAGEVYLSGSQYAKQFEKPFDAKQISEAMAKKFGVEASDISDMWTLKADISKGLGTMIHAALELYGKYDGLAKTLEKTTNLHDHPIVKKAVESFYAGRESEQAEYEVLVIDHANKRVGRIDRLLIANQIGVYRVQDYKTNAVLTPEKLGVYWKQLKFYAELLETNGYRVEGLDIFAWDGTWKTHSKELK